jgi:hypothetical protein
VRLHNSLHHHADLVQYPIDLLANDVPELVESLTVEFGSSISSAWTSRATIGRGK